MKLIFDENISYRIIKKIQVIYPNAIHVSSLGFSHTDDTQIWAYAKVNQYHIVSQDADFYEISLVKGFPPKLIWIKTGNVSTQFIADLFIKSYSEIENFINSPNESCLEMY
jgi:predicted nuclease of predicted toxin-antitoxin system